MNPANIPKNLRDPLKKLMKALIYVSLENLDISLVTNKACLDAIADTCYDAVQKFTCTNTECISPKAPPVACTDSETVHDAFSTYKAIQAITTPCKEIRPTIKTTTTRRTTTEGI